MINVKKDLNTLLSKELFDVFVGPKLGEGANRKVYECLIDPTVVIKIETWERSFSNIAEWETWQEVQWDDWHKKWFVPCVDISPCGKILIQKRATIYGNELGLPKKVPAHFTDLHTSNWGVYQGKPVCVDYGATFITQRGLTKRMKNAKWYDV